MKKTICALLLLAVLLSAAACGSSPAPATEAQRCVPAGGAEEAEGAAAPQDGLGSDGKIHVYLVGTGETFYTPDSSFIHYLRYYPRCGHLLINMSGKDYSFANIGVLLWEDFISTENIDEYYTENIKGRTEYYIRDYEPGTGQEFVLEYLP